MKTTPMSSRAAPSATPGTADLVAGVASRLRGKGYATARAPARPDEGTASSATACRSVKHGAQSRGVGRRLHCCPACLARRRKQQGRPRQTQRTALYGNLSDASLLGSGLGLLPLRQVHSCMSCVFFRRKRCRDLQASEAPFFRPHFALYSSGVSPCPARWRFVSILNFASHSRHTTQASRTASGDVERIVAIGAGTLEPGFFPAGMTVADLEQADRAYVAQMRCLMPEPERLQDFLTRFMDFWNGASAGKDLFAKVPCPVLLVAGDEDDHAPVRTVLEAHQLLPCSSCASCPGLGTPVSWTNSP